MNGTKCILTQNALGIFTACLAMTLFPASGFATALPPVLQGLGGAGRGGVAKESAFTNPAATGMLTDTSGYYYYEKPSVPDFNAGGLAYGVGVSDGGSPLKGSFAYTKQAMARIDPSLPGMQRFEDRSELRFSSGVNLGGGVLGGIGTRYVSKGNGPDADRTKFFQGDVGVIVPLLAGLTAGATYENVFNHEDELPPTLGVGAKYFLGGGIAVYADGYKLMKGLRERAKGFALAAEVVLGSDFILRGGRFQDAYYALHGWSGGLSWAGPRASFDYAFRVAGDGPHEKDHTLGLTLKF